MTLPREQIPESVWRAREADSAARSAAEDDWDKYLAAKDELVAVVTTGDVERCPQCGSLTVVVGEGRLVNTCVDCSIGWDRSGSWE